jgi:flagellar biogenesis protein FliO
MSTRVDVEEIRTTPSERLLAAVLAVFLLIGGVWAYTKLDDAARSTTPPDYSYRGTPADHEAIARLDSARGRLERADTAASAARSELVLRREAYRTALEAHRRGAARLGRRYDAAQVAYAAAKRRQRSDGKAVRTAQPAADRAEQHIAQVQNGRTHDRELLAFGLRLLFVLTTLGFGYWLLAHLRRRRSRYFLVGLAFVVYAAVLAVVMATDYLTDWFDPLDLGPLVLSMVGVGLTLLAFVGLQRYLARRVPQRRVRKRECPFCGYPVRENTHCEGCGRDVIAPCSRCERPRRVGSSFCGACGAA